MRVTLDSPGSPYSCVESHCCWGHHSSWCFLGLEGGPQFISFQGAGVREGYYIFWCQTVVNSSQKIHRVSEKEPKGSGVAELPESRGKMASASLVFVWLLLTMRMVTSAVYLEPEAEGEHTFHSPQIWGWTKKQTDYWLACFVLFYWLQ